MQELSNDRNDDGEVVLLRLAESGDKLPHNGIATHGRDPRPPQSTPQRGSCDSMSSDNYPLRIGARPASCCRMEAATPPLFLVEGLVGRAEIEERDRLRVAWVISSNGNLSCGVPGEAMIVRFAPKQTEAALRKPNTRVFDLSGRPMRGWILVQPAGLKTKTALAKWVKKRGRLCVFAASEEMTRETQLRLKRQHLIRPLGRPSGPPGSSGPTPG